MLWETLLASMLTMVPPGNSLYSMVNIPFCDKACQELPACEVKSDWRCSKPKYSGRKHQKLITKALEDGISFEQASKNTRPYAFKRYETKKEGMVRYITIAKSASRVSEIRTRSICTNKCTEDDEECIKECKKSAPWSWDRKALALMMITIARYESGFRRDVHSGDGAGDCTWKKNGRVVSPKVKGAKMDRNSCRSFCLGQINIGKGSIRVNGNVWKEADLVGIDAASTDRCFEAATKILSRSRHYCNSWYSGPRTKDWARATFSAYGSGNACRLSAKKYENKDGTRVTLNGFKVEGKIVWSATRPFNADPKSLPIEAYWTGNRSNKFWNLYRHPRILDPKLKKQLKL